MKQTTLDLIKNINENTFIPATTQNELFELFQLDTVADLRKVSRNFMKVYELLEHFDNQTSNATKEKEGIVKFGTETGNAIDAETWKQAIGQTLGGYISKVENKEAGKWYINDLTNGKIYKCIQNHSSTSFDITKFVDITNIGLSDKLENLFSSENTYFRIGTMIIQCGRNEVPNGSGEEGTRFRFPKPFKNSCLAITANDVGGGARSVTVSPVSNSEFKAWSRFGKDFSGSIFYWIAIGF